MRPWDYFLFPEVNYKLFVSRTEMAFIPLLPGPELTLQFLYSADSVCSFDLMMRKK